ncbi:ScyD/ScyE family protein [Nocardioides dongxiaopingii]|uniref:ScyD/ScyE family protein n=1 Tax=Nocardioides sp. S-1144 TaxID=2582905 RepID=UPI0011645C26|nr:ScyD/ScyE family protein [Nocardioides sp. S-1144]QCW50183.2 ScyD/ScyE family protein [Nocardioides sp. S-1144]
MPTTTATRAAVAGLAVALAAPFLTSALATSSAADDTAGSPAPPRAVTLVPGLVSPLSVAVGGRQTRWFSQNFTGTLMRQRGDRPARPVYQAERGVEVGAVSVHRGTVVFATTLRRQTHLMRLGRGGAASELADLGAHERRTNPDGGVRYGFRRLGADCASQLPERFPARYRGIVESHPYATTTAGGRTWVADAAANAILEVDRRGRVSTTAVLPPVPVRITRAAAEANGMPACTVGHVYVFEGVPTDVEVGPRGQLYVSALPGGPEDGSTGAQGRVFRVDPASGEVTLVAKGLVSATGLAVTPRGAVYVAELFGSRISRIAPGARRARPFLPIGMPGDVELHRGRLFATADVLAEGRLVAIRR